MDVRLLDFLVGDFKPFVWMVFPSDGNTEVFIRFRLLAIAASGMAHLYKKAIPGSLVPD